MSSVPNYFYKANTKILQKRLNNIFTPVIRM